MVMLGDRFGERRRTGLAVEVERVTTLDDAPAVVGALLDEIHLLPQVLAVLPNPQIAGGAIDVQSPRVAEAIRPRFGPHALLADERVVLGDGVILATVGMVDIDAQHLGAETTKVLAGEIGIGVGGAVAGRDVKHAIVAKVEVAA